MRGPASAGTLHPTECSTSGRRSNPPRFATSVAVVRGPCDRLTSAALHPPRHATTRHAALRYDTQRHDTPRRAAPRLAALRRERTPPHPAPRRTTPPPHSLSCGMLGVLATVITALRNASKFDVKAEMVGLQHCHPPPNAICLYTLRANPTTTLFQQLPVSRRGRPISATCHAHRAPDPPTYTPGNECRAGQTSAKVCSSYACLYSASTLTTPTDALTIPRAGVLAHSHSLPAPLNNNDHNHRYVPNIDARGAVGGRAFLDTILRRASRHCPNVPVRDEVFPCETDLKNKEKLIL